MKKTIIAILFLLWLAAILTIFFIIQKPDFLSILPGLKDLFFTLLIPFWITLLGACIGSYLLPNADSYERLILGSALGLAFFGLVGFGLCVIGLAKVFLLWGIILTLSTFFVLTGKLKLVWEDAAQIAKEFKISIKNVECWIPIITGIACLLVIILSLAPPVEDFDALFYHLTVPAWWLRDGGLSLVSIPHYWFPQIVEGIFVWPMALGFDTATHLIHFIWLFLTISLLWQWARRLWGDLIAWDILLILLTMPSILWLATWAYTDYALTFAGIGTLYSLWKWQNTRNRRWLFISGIMSGLAVSVKYTGFVVPLAGLILIALWEHNILQQLKIAIYFFMITCLIASPWYIRNWIWMKNPLYPFVFGGRFWDSFLAQAYSASGTGIGLNPAKLLMLPMTATLGTQDMNFFDGRIGPFFLIFFPLTLWAFWESRREQNEKQRTLFAIGIFGILSIIAWTIGVINSANLFQTRLLFPALIPFAIPMALGLNLLHKLDSPWLKISFIVRFMLVFVVAINLLNFSLQILARNPISVATGITSRQAYIEKQQPGYFHALELIKIVPENAKIYFLFEPRSYGMNGQVQPDSINTNFSHDLWLNKTPERIIMMWKKLGYSYIMVSKSGADFIFNSETASSNNEEAALKKVEILLKFVGESQDGEYILYRIP
jgi:hypothetical protein